MRGERPYMNNTAPDTAHEHNIHNAEHHAHTAEHHPHTAVKQNGFFYFIARVASFVTANLIFKRKFIRNEIKGKKGPFVIIANHEAAYDFVNLIGATSRKMTFVISESFYRTVPVRGVIKRMGVIPKQQFQTTIKDIKSMKAVVDNGRILTIYPAGLMCEDGLSTPIPDTTYKFLQWLKVDVYMARTYGTYFAMPKWSSGMRPGRTYIDVYKLFSKEELETMEESQIRERTENAMLFDAYRDQEIYKAKYKNGDDIRGLENVLYKCPSCKSEFSMHVKDNSVIYCEKCGFAHRSDEYGFLHNEGGGDEIRYVSDWSSMIYNELCESIARGDEGEMTLEARIQMLDKDDSKFSDVGIGELSLTRDKIYISCDKDGELFERSVPITNLASLPFSPGRYVEVQHSSEIFRCHPTDAKQVMKFINKLKIFHTEFAKEHNAHHT